MRNIVVKSTCIIIAFALLIGCSDDISEYEPDSIFQPGTDITVQLRTALESGKDINLDEGTFFVSESIIVPGYCGIVQGHPDRPTRIEVAEGFKATVDPSLNMPAHELTEIFTIYNAECDITFQNLIFEINGSAPAELHSNPWLGDVTTIDNVIVVAAEVGSEFTVTYRDLEIYGELSTDEGAARGRNLAWPLIVVGPEGSNAKVNMIVENCLVSYAGYYAIEYWRIIGGDGQFYGNKIINSNSAMWIGPGMTATEVDVMNNEFTNIDHACITNQGSAKLCFMNNTLDGVAMDDDCPE